MGREWHYFDDHVVRSGAAWPIAHIVRRRGLRIDLGRHDNVTGVTTFA
jgi:hypothetical protein